MRQLSNRERILIETTWRSIREAFVHLDRFIPVRHEIKYAAWRLKFDCLPERGSDLCHLWDWVGHRLIGHGEFDPHKLDHSGKANKWEKIQGCGWIRCPLWGWDVDRSLCKMRCVDCHVSYPCSVDGLCSFPRHEIRPLTAAWIVKNSQYQHLAVAPLSFAADQHAALGIGKSAAIRKDAKGKNAAPNP